MMPLLADWTLLAASRISGTGNRSASWLIIHQNFRFFCFYIVLPELEKIDCFTFNIGQSNCLDKCIKTVFV
jgi:hypothetical protein